MTDKLQQLTFEETFRKEEKKLRKRIWNYHDARKEEKKKDDYYKKTVKPFIKRCEAEYDAQKHMEAGKKDRKRFKEIRERDKHKQGMNMEDLDEAIDELVNEERHPQKGDLGPRKGELTNSWTARLQKCNNDIAKLWYRNDRAVVANTPRYIEGFPAKQVVERHPPCIQPHYALQSDIFKDSHCTECRRIGMSCALTFSYLTKFRHHPRSLHSPPCSRCKRKGLRCHAEWTDGDEEELKRKNAFALPLWWDDTMRL